MGGYHRMQTRFLEGEGKCLEANQFDSSSTLGGAAFMDDCGDHSGQLRSIVPVGEGTFRLKNFFQGETKCLEGNRAGFPVPSFTRLFKWKSAHATDSVRPKALSSIWMGFHSSVKSRDFFGSLQTSVQAAAMAGQASVDPLP